MGDQEREEKAEVRSLSPPSIPFTLSRQSPHTSLTVCGSMIMMKSQRNDGNSCTNGMIQTKKSKQNGHFFITFFFLISWISFADWWPERKRKVGYNQIALHYIILFVVSEVWTPTVKNIKQQSDLEWLRSGGGFEDAGIFGVCRSMYYHRVVVIHVENCALSFLFIYFSLSLSMFFTLEIVFTNAKQRQMA